MLAALLNFIPPLGIGLVAVLAGGTKVISLLRRYCREPNASPSPEITKLHQSKHDTPSLGGVLIWLGVLAALAWGGKIATPEGFMFAAQIGLFALLGGVDDFLKLRSRKRGLATLTKLAWQTVLALPIALLARDVLAANPAGLALHVPYFGNFPLGNLFVPWCMLVIVATANGVNFTDGLDGLASGCSITCCLALLAGAIFSGASVTSPTLHGLAGLVGSLFGFLYFNRQPAKVFMGDLGSLPLGGVIGLAAVLLKLEWLLFVAGGVFVVETISVALQITAIRLFHGRVFRCAPLHHHFQLKGWRERTIVRRFWLAGLICACVGLLISQEETRHDIRTNELLTTGSLDANANRLTSKLSFKK